MLRRVLAITAAAAIALAGLVAAPSTPASAVARVQLPTGDLVPVAQVDLVRATFDAINDYRAKQGLPELRFAPHLFEIAQSWSDQMVANDAFEHRHEHWKLYPAAWSRAGEIIAARTDRDAVGLVQQWIDSDAHRRIMLSDVTVMGPGITLDSGGTAEWFMYGTVNFGSYASGAIPTYASIDEWIAAGSPIDRDDVVGGFHSVQGRSDGTIAIEGWALDFSDRALASNVRITIDGVSSVTIAARHSIWPWGAGEWRNGHDFRVDRRAATGVHRVCVVAEDTYGAGDDRSLGCREVVVPPPTDRLAGANRYDTAVRISQRYHADPTAIDTVYVATGEKYPDALSLAPAAAQPGSALLLTPQSQLWGSVRTELERLDPDHVVIVGGEDSVSAAVLQQVQAALPGSTVERLAGANRYETSVMIAKRAFPDATLAYVASGQLFPDALSAAPVAAARNAPVILTPAAALPATAREHLDATGIGEVVIAGGPPSVSAAVASELADVVGSAPARIAGADRYETNRLLASTTSTGTQPEVLLASGLGFPDALAGAAVAASSGPLLLGRPGCVPSETVDVILGEYRPATLVVLGGTPTLSEAAAALAPCS